MQYFFLYSLSQKGGTKPGEAQDSSTGSRPKQYRNRFSVSLLCYTFACLQTYQHRFMFAFLLIPITLVQLHFRELSTWLSQPQLSPWISISSVVPQKQNGAWEQPVRGSVLNFTVCGSSVRKFRTRHFPLWEHRARQISFRDILRFCCTMTPLILLSSICAAETLHGQLLYGLLWNRKWWSFNTISPIIVHHVRIILFRFTKVNKGLF